MKEYLLILFVAGAGVPGEEHGVQATMVTRQQCNAVVEIYRKLDSPVRASCFPPHVKYSTGGVVPASHSWQVPPSLGDGTETLPIAPSRVSGPEDDRKAP